MRGERQGDQECVLATIADLTKTPLAQVRATVLAYTGKKTWVDVCNEGQGELTDLFWKAVFYVCDIYDDKKQLHHAILQVSANHDELSVPCHARIIDPSISELPNPGKGVLVLIPVVGNGGHIVPWENGLAYDTNLHGQGEILALLRMRWWLIGFGYYVRSISQLLRD